MAPVYGKPFLSYVLDCLIEAGIRRIVLATGYKHEFIEAWFGTHYREAEIIYSNEDTPLFTGGAIRQAASKLESEEANLTVALRRVDDTGRYGSVDCDNGQILAFREKTESKGAGDINGGIYAIRRDWLMELDLPAKFSFEKELMQPLAGKQGFYGLSFSDYFIDIGVPEDYWRAQKEFGALFEPDEFLFLDRDGVLNQQIVGDYVRNWSQWKWLPGVLPSMAELAKRFKRIFLISNQQGVGKGVMSAGDLEDVHRRMMADIEAAGGRLDAIYTCTDLESAHSPNRKPEIGMAMQAKRDFPEVVFHRSVMIGDNVTDMLFAQKAHMRAAYITKNNPVPQAVQDITDLCFRDLSSLIL